MALLSGRSSPIQKPQWYLAAAKNMANHTESNKWAVEPHTWNSIFLGYNLVHIIIHTTTSRQYCSWLRAEHWLTNELNIIPISYSDNEWAPDAWSFLVAKKDNPWYLVPLGWTEQIMDQLHPYKVVIMYRLWWLISSTKRFLIFSLLHLTLMNVVTISPPFTNMVSHGNGVSSRYWKSHSYYEVLSLIFMCISEKDGIDF